MAQITTGLTNGGLTTHYAFTYEDSLRQTATNPTGPEPARTNAVIAAAEADFTQMTGWFGGTALDVSFPAAVNVKNAGGGAAWATSGGSLTVTIKPTTTGTATDVRYLLVAEMTEQFMRAHGLGWYGDNTEGSEGEGLSRFLARQFLDTNGLGAPPAGFGNSNAWLSSSRDDWVNNVKGKDDGPDEVTGCTLLFIWYLFSQLGFTIEEIVAGGADNLGQVYRNLTGDTGDPFPFFKRLMDTAFPGTSTISTGSSNIDNPFPLGILSFWVDKSTYGHDEVDDVISSSAHGTFSDAFWLVLEGFNIQSFLDHGISAPALSGSFKALTGLQITTDPSGTKFEDTSDARIPQRIRFPFDVTFQSSTLADFPGPKQAARFTTLRAQAKVGTADLLGASAQTEFELVGGADPYFTDVDPAKGNDFWLSRDLRVFTATPSLNDHPVSGGPAFSSDTFAGGYSYIQSLLSWLNDPTNGFTTGARDPFADGTIPQQGAALTGDSSVTPWTFVPWPPSLHRNYNFAIARVRLQDAVGESADEVKVFFRMWTTQSADTDFQPGTTYKSHQTGGKPQWPLPASDAHTFPFFATGNAPNLSDPANPEYGTNGVNNRSVGVTSGDQGFAYFGVFLNVYDPGMTVNGTAVQAVMGGTHHCLVAEIAYDGAPIVNAGGVTMSPANSDKLAQRNLQVTHSDNPGPADTHRVPQTFDVRPSAALTRAPGDLLDYPDELMIDWGQVPLGSTAHIYWPAVDATAVLTLARRLYGSTSLTASDAHTVDAPVTRGVTYVPIPPGAGERYAGLLTIDLPTTVTTGQEFDVVIRRVTTRRQEVVEIPVSEVPRIAATPSTPAKKAPARKAAAKKAAARKATSAATATTTAKRTTSAAIEPTPPRVTERIGAAPTAAAYRKGPLMTNWRYVTGTFQVKIPVTTAAVMLWPDENTLAIVRWRLTQMQPTNRWVPVLTRYAEYLAARIDGLGGDSTTIQPSPDGAPPTGSIRGDGAHTHTGRVVDVTFDCYGELEGFTIEACCGGRHTFPAREPGVRDLVLRALKERLTLVVVTEGEKSERVCRIHVRF